MKRVHQVPVLIEAAAIGDAVFERDLFEPVALFVVHENVSEGRRVRLARVQIDVGKRDDVFSDGSRAAEHVDGIVLRGEVETLRLEDERVGDSVERLRVPVRELFLVHRGSFGAFEKVRPVLAAHILYFPGPTTYPPPFPQPTSFQQHHTYTYQSKMSKKART